MSSQTQDHQTAATTHITDDNDDDPPMLSLQALEALKQFLNEQQTSLTEQAGAAASEEEEVRLVSEDWRLSQFWYDRDTAKTVCDEIRYLLRSASGPAAVACISCPTIYAYLKKLDPDITVKLLEYDQRFQQYGSGYTFYDYNEPEELPLALKHAFQVLVVDPPYLSRECLEKVAQTITFLAQPEDACLLLLTGAVQEDSARELLNVRPCNFRPQHSHKLGNEFRLFTNYNPAERLGGWEQSI